MMDDVGVKSVASLVPADVPLPPRLANVDPDDVGKPFSQLASSLGDSMSQPQSTFNRFDEIDIPPYDLRSTKRLRLSSRPTAEGQRIRTLGRRPERFLENANPM
jgi:hypothetical protein